jgi:hypothetical protein
MILQKSLPLSENQTVLVEGPMAGLRKPDSFSLSGLNLRERALPSHRAIHQASENRTVLADSLAWALQVGPMAGSGKPDSFGLSNLDLRSHRTSGVPLRQLCENRTVLVGSLAWASLIGSIAGSGKPDSFGLSGLDFNSHRTSALHQHSKNRTVLVVCPVWASSVGPMAAWSGLEAGEISFLSSWTLDALLSIPTRKTRQFLSCERSAPRKPSRTFALLCIYNRKIRQFSGPSGNCLICPGVLGCSCRILGSRSFSQQEFSLDGLAGNRSHSCGVTCYSGMSGKLREREGDGSQKVIGSGLRLATSARKVYNSIYDVLNMKKRPVKSLGKLWSLVSSWNVLFVHSALGIPPSGGLSKGKLNMIVAGMAITRQVVAQDTYVPKWVAVGETSYSHKYYVQQEVCHG